MKLKVLNIIACLFVAACTITSCLSDEEIVYETNYDASISAFAIADSIITYYPSVTAEGKDTTLSTAVVGTDYPFVIDQNNGLIYNADSLPVGTDVSKVVVDITYDGYYVFLERGDNDTIWIQTDSLNFNNPIQFKVLSEMNTFGRTYTAKINVHKQDPELLAWTKVTSDLSTEIQAQKAVYANKCMYVFAEQASQVAVTSSTNGKTWTELQAIDIPVKADYSSAISWNGKIYILANQELYVSENGANWTKVETTQTFSNLTAACKTKMVAIDTANKYIESADATNWDSYETIADNFPKSPYSFAAYALSTNANMERLVLMGNNPVEEDTTNVVWSQIDNEHAWVAMTYEDNMELCPKFENPTIIHYNNMLYAFGGPAVDGGNINAFASLYLSIDNGISWEPATEKLLFPEEFQSLYEEAEGNYSCIVDNNHYIWLIWSKTGEVWKGRINKLGFVKQ